MINLENYNKRIQVIIDEIERDLDDNGYTQGQIIKSEDGKKYKIKDRKLHLLRNFDNKDKMEYRLQAAPIVVPYKSKTRTWGNTMHALYCKVFLIENVDAI